MAWYDAFSDVWNSAQALPGGISDAAGDAWGGIKGIPGRVRGFTDDLGITVPDPSKSPEYQQLVAAANAFRDAYGMAGPNVAETRGMDLGTIRMLQDAAAGNAPSAAESLMRRNIDTNARQSLGLASTLQGTNPGAALRAGLESFSDAGARSAADIGALRANEIAAARGQLAQATGGAAQRDVLRENSQGGLYANTVGAPYGAQERANAANQGLWGSLLGGAAKGLAASDPRLKTNVADGSGAADSFLASLDPRTFEYKQPGPLAPPGQRLGVMADQLPGRDVVSGPDGAQYINANVISDILAGMGRLNQKVEQGGTVAGDRGDYGRAMTYMTAPRRDVGPMARAEGGMSAGPRAVPPAEPQMDAATIRDWLVGLGIMAR